MTFFKRHKAKFIALAMGAGLELVITNGEEINIYRMVSFMACFVVIVFFDHRIKKLARWVRIDKIRNPSENLDLDEYVKKTHNTTSRYPPYILGEVEPPKGSRTDYGFPWHKPPKEDEEEQGEQPGNENK